MQRILATSLSNLGVLLIKITPPSELGSVIEVYERAIEHSGCAAELRSRDAESQAHLAMLYVNVGIAYRRMMNVDRKNLIERPKPTTRRWKSRKRWFWPVPR